MTTNARASRQTKSWPSAWKRAFTTGEVTLGHNTQSEGANTMADKTPIANDLARDPQRRIAATTAIGMNALKPIIHFQASMLRMWADSIEKFAGNYEKKLDETATTVEERDKERAA
ncbi:hypothetical protein QA649_39565 [Bradyrhizobium sp. CB1717]|uniref:hypothetical protein n=1 Tax=Bradyrhizobium sp. CB1717 TaxID=3039154 RepID=UPI0024B11D00|nr:hypothetical protein [Bradyrhizobium sp. CB1717]WFU24037.1 hypothetical protein QA649_39565 [Bradyrhizobium sp. CB1717]